MGATSFSGGHTVDTTGAAVGSVTPSTQAHGDSAASGSSAEASRVDHKHAMPAAGGVSQANQAAIEAETNENTYIPPDLLKHSPGMAKAWCSIAVAGTIGALDYNVASITDTGTGNRAIVIDTDFSATTYAIVDGGMGYTEDDFDKFGYDTYAVGSIRVRLVNDAGTAVDLASSHVFYGDQ